MLGKGAMPAVAVAYDPGSQTTVAGAPKCGKNSTPTPIVASTCVRRNAPIASEAAAQRVTGTGTRGRASQPLSDAGQFIDADLSSSNMRSTGMRPMSWPCWIQVASPGQAPPALDASGSAIEPVMVIPMRPPRSTPSAIHPRRRENPGRPRARRLAARRPCARRRTSPPRSRAPQRLWTIAQPSAIDARPPPWRQGVPINRSNVYGWHRLRASFSCSGGSVAPQSLRPPPRTM